MPKSIAIVNDVSGYGRCSATVALPILSAMKIQCGLVPTAILSNQTEYPEYTMLDFTEHMEGYIKTWKALSFEFDAIYTGFLGSAKQIQIINKMIELFQFQHIIVDPVMGDNGKLYPSYTDEMCIAMEQLVSKATVIIPNVTELCILSHNKYHNNLSIEEIIHMCKTLCDKNTNLKIVVTGIEKENHIGNIYYENDNYDLIWNSKIEPMRPGTGDVFSSVLAGCILRNISPTETNLPADFVQKCLETTNQFHTPFNAGVNFEEHLKMLTNL